MSRNASDMGVFPCTYYKVENGRLPVLYGRRRSDDSIVDFLKPPGTSRNLLIRFTTALRALNLILLLRDEFKSFGQMSVGTFVFIDRHVNLGCS